MSKSAISNLSWKTYRCKECGHKTEQQTNHFGETYSWFNSNACPSCPPFKRPTTWVCAEKVPKGMTRPAKWKKATVTAQIVQA